MKINGNQIKIGNVLEHKGSLFVVTKTQAVKPGKGGAFNQVEMKSIIEKAALLTSSFKPIMHVPVCGNCGYKGEKLVDKCPNCKSQFIL